MNSNLIFARAKLAEQIRNKLIEANYLEVVPTMLNQTVPVEPTLHSIKVDGYGYLPTSPEAYLKKVVASSKKNCFAISATFRDMEGKSDLHNPEFLMVEWYNTQSKIDNMMKLTQAIVTDVFPELKSDCWESVSLFNLWSEHLGIDLNSLLTDQAMANFALERGYQIDNASFEQLFFQIVLNEVEPKFPKSPFFLIDYPAIISPLAKVDPNNPNKAMRFELYIKGVEIANGNAENTDSKTIRLMMEKEASTRLNSPLIDDDFVECLADLPETCVGVGLGIDRLLALKHNVAIIDLL